METNLMLEEDLNRPSEPLTFITKTGIEKEETLEVIDKLRAAMENYPDLLGLSAPQIGIFKRVFCLRFNDRLKFFINPIITKKKGLNIVIETCASMPGKEIVIGRPEEITVVYYTDEFKYEDNKLLGPVASLFDQQAQILDGILPSALGLVSDIEADGKIEESDLEVIIPFYKDTFLPQKLASIETEIKNDPDAKKEFRKLKLTEGVINGRIAVVEPEEEAKRNATIKGAVTKTTYKLGAEKKAKTKANFKQHVNRFSKNK